MSAEPPRAAVALAYAEGDAAPRVIAKGRGLVADEIVRRAREAGVVVKSAPELCTLLMQVELDRAIPPRSTSRSPSCSRGSGASSARARPRRAGGRDERTGAVCASLRRRGGPRALPALLARRDPRAAARADRAARDRDGPGRRAGRFHRLDAARGEPRFRGARVRRRGERRSEPPSAGGRPALFYTSLDGVRIHFATQRAAPTVFDGLAALRVRVPETVLRLQRRDHFRVAPPLARPLELEAPHPAGGRVRLRVLDISCGGAAVALAPPQLALAPGELLRGCAVELPGPVRLVFDAEVRSVEPGRGPGGATRCGLKFVNLPGAALTAIQRYVLQLDRERRARL
ncbi:MAG: PilZ domain-containing protein [Burkholderiales bacterium]|nr:PilZ domain-containing protein [Burkholderiales bacterium]